MNVERAYLECVKEIFFNMKRLAERAMEQLNLDELHYSPNQESNSIAILVKHLNGNMRSRFTDFLTADGEKPNRNRDMEFEGRYDSKNDLLKAWNEGWEVVFHTLSGLTEEDLLKTVYIRGEPHSVLQAIERQVVHYSHHIGQIVFLAKQIKNEQWKTLSIPRRQSNQLNETMTGNTEKR
jgi:uncharacterized damage-inducible protein DinB